MEQGEKKELTIGQKMDIKIEVQKLKQRLGIKSNSQTGTSSTSNKLDWALETLGAEVKKEDITGYENMIIEAAESLEQCQKCSKIGKETIDCYRTKLVLENGRLYSESGICKKAQQYILNQKIERVFGETGIGKRFRNRRFETFEVNDSNRAAYELCKQFCNSYTAESTGVILTGDYGTGKTHLAAAIIAELVKKNIAGAFIVVPDLLRAIRKSFDEKGNEELQKVFDTVKKSELLVLDDLGAEKSSDWVREQLFMLINARYENMLPTIITTNSSLQELASQNVLGQRIVSRIIEMTDGAIIKADDYRMRKLV